ncbi:MULTISPECIES: alpha/beta fold hydrolase [Deinococcus]|uniref:alpha/beta fold hydrolase n=1 Tax=Deinococcus TaxID=1298 RepID=UPI0022759B74|nr:MULTISPECIES: alpha/beta hydrolase [Deinococcus]MCY1702853.1 alpha/beta hydrolase [Deinococcus sp. SL84]
MLLYGGPGCVNYLRPVADLLPEWHCILPDPRAVGGSSGEPQGVMGELADLESLRESLGLRSWSVLGHSWGADLGLAYALEYPGCVQRLVCLAGTGRHNDRDWSAAYQASKHLEAEFRVEWNGAVGQALLTDWRQYVKQPTLLGRLARLKVSVTFLHMERDIRPPWFVRQLAELLPEGRFAELPGAGHYAWLTHGPQLQEALACALTPGACPHCSPTSP